MKRAFLTAITLFAFCSMLFAQEDPDRQAKIEKALKELKDKDADVRGNAIWALEKLGAKEYADEIAKVLNDSSEYSILYEKKEEMEYMETTVSAEAERVLKEWGVPR